jgi:hypothetical protein
MRLGQVNGVLLLGNIFLVSLSGCGGGETPPAKSANGEETPREHEGRPAMSASAEIGALDESKVTQTFRGAQGALEKCVAAGAGRNELEGGDIAFLVKIGSGGRVVHVHAEKSTLGDRDTEKCMLQVLKKRSWPEPQGGDVGLARNSFGFDMPNDARPPTAWEASRMDETVATLSGKIASCKQRTHGDLTATVYVDPEGSAVSVGIASSDDSGEDAADCLVSVLKDAKYPSPGSWPAKVSFPL